MARSVMTLEKIIAKFNDFDPYDPFDMVDVQAWWEGYVSALVDIGDITEEEHEWFIEFIKREMNS